MMKGKIILLIAFIILIIPSSGSAAFQKKYQNAQLRAINGDILSADQTTAGACYETPPLPVLKCRYYDKASFEGSLESINENNLELDEDIFGGILPHHLVASPMIARFFKALTAEDKASPATIVVLAPNHKRIGNEFLHTGVFAWDTPFGQLRADEIFIDELAGTLKTGSNFKLLEEEHSISSLVPYIRYFFPEAEIVPVLIHGSMPSDDCKSLAAFLAREASEKPTLILASIDFSHGLATPKSLERDEITKKAIEFRDYDLIFGMDNTCLDAPPTLVSFLMTMDMLASGNSLVESDRLKSNEIHANGLLLEHGEASEYLVRPVSETTSYMTWLFAHKP